jgi:hypothetical protein
MMRYLMSGRRVLGGVLGLALLLALAVGLIHAQGPELGRDTANISAAEEAASVSDFIPIQGRLTDADGNPLDGSYHLTLRLYDVDEGGTALCEDRWPVDVSRGLFSTYMISEDCPIDGRQLYLGIEVENDGEMTPRAFIDNVPYAWSLRPGATINGDESDGILSVENVNGGTFSYAVMGTSSGSGYGVIGTSSTGAGVWGMSSGGGWAGYFTGDVGQSRTGDGLAKASVYAGCRDTGASITRSFNQVGGTITIADGASVGRCTIDFGFQIDDRYFVATALSAGVGGNARGISCDWGADNEKLDCFRWDASGNGANGEIMVLVY